MREENRKGTKSTSFVLDKEDSWINIMLMFLWFLSDMVYTSGKILQDRLRDMQTCRIILASAYVLHCLSATWSQLQIRGRSLRWEWVLIDMSPLNTRDWV